MSSLQGVASWLLVCEMFRLAVRPFVAELLTTFCSEVTLKRARYRGVHVPRYGESVVMLTSRNSKELVY